MIVAAEKIPEPREFEDLLKSTTNLLLGQAQKKPDYFQTREAQKFEKDVFAAMNECSKNTPFYEKISLISGHKFPDIVALKYYGVEVKTAKQGWKSTGNSVLETTRVEEAERIYMLFGKLSNPLDIKVKPYQSCLFDIAVTHSPRYLIDMEIQTGETIFDKMKISYEELSMLDNPIRKVVQYYRGIVKKGEEPWWMENVDGSDAPLPPMVRLWRSLSDVEKTKFVNEAMARFPEIFGNSQTKYSNLALWLTARHGIVDSSLRDRFTAGGKVNLNVGGKIYKKVPKIFSHLQENAREVLKAVEQLKIEDVQHYWGEKTYISEAPIDLWIKLVVEHSKKILPSAEAFIVHLLGSALGETRSSQFLREEMMKYGLSY